MTLLVVDIGVLAAKVAPKWNLKVRGFWKVEWIGKSISFQKVAKKDL